MSLIFDAVIMVMLTATIFYLARLSNKLNILRDQKDELAKSLEFFSNATDNAIVAVEDLQIKGQQVCRKIEESIKKGQIVADDIEFLIDRAAKRVKEFEGKAAEQTQRQKLGGYKEAELVDLLRKKQAAQN